MEIPVRKANESDVVIDEIENAEKREYHLKRFRKCLVQFAQELAASEKVQDILDKYKVTILEVDGEERIGIEFPDAKN